MPPSFHHRDRLWRYFMTAIFLDRLTPAASRREPQFVYEITHDFDKPGKSPFRFEMLDAREHFRGLAGDMSHRGIVRPAPEAQARGRAPAPG